MVHRFRDLFSSAHGAAPFALLRAHHGIRVG